MRVPACALCTFIATVPTISLAEDTPPSLTSDQMTRLVEFDARPLHQISNVELAEYLDLRVTRQANNRPPASDEIAFFAQHALSQPYRRGALRFDLQEGDCVTFVERVISLALASDWSSYHMLCNRLRHKDGVVDRRNRNWFTEADWIPNNAWLFEEITDRLGSAQNSPAKDYLHRINRQRFYKEKGLDIVAPGLQVMTLKYIPQDRISDILPQLRSGDIALVIRGTPDNQFCDHMGVISREADGTIDLVHSAPPRARQDTLTGLMKRCPWITGFKFLRLREQPRAVVHTELESRSAGLQVTPPAEVDSQLQSARSKR